MNLKFVTVVRPINDDSKTYWDLIVKLGEDMLIERFSSRAAADIEYARLMEAWEHVLKLS